MKSTKKILAAVLAVLMAIPMMTVMPFSAGAATVTEASPVKYGLVKTGGNRGDGSNGNLCNDGGNDNTTAMLWEFDLSSITEEYCDVDSATFSLNVWDISNTNIANQQLDFYYCNPKNMMNYSNYLNNGNYQDNSYIRSGDGTTAPDSFKLAFGIEDGNYIGYRAHTYDSNSATITFSNEALKNAIKKANNEKWGSIVFVAMHNGKAASTWSDIWAGLPSLSYSTSAITAKEFAQSAISSIDASYSYNAPGSIVFSGGGDVYSTNVLYSANGNYDSSYFNGTLNGNNKLGFNIYPASSRVVYAYEDAGSVIGFPLIAKVQKSQAAATTVHWGVNYLAVGDTPNWSLTKDWTSCSGDRTWSAAEPSGNMGTDRLNFDASNTDNYNIDISVGGWGSTSGSYTDSSPKTYSNLVIYDNSKINFNGGYSYSIDNDSMPKFKASADGGGHWIGSQGAWNNIVDSNWENININGITNVEMRVLNIKPIKDIVSASDFATQFNNVVNNEWLYTSESLANFYNAYAKVLAYNLRSYDFSTDTGFNSAVSDMSSAISDFNAYKAPVKKTFTATFKSAGGATIEARQITAGEALGTLPANTAGATHNAGTNTHFGYTWNGVTTADTVIQADAEFTEAAATVDCEFDEAYTAATAESNGFTTYTCVCSNSYVEYDAQDFTAYNAAVEDYSSTVGDADYEATYTAASRADYEAAVDAAKLTDAQIADETLSPTAIENAAAAITAAKALLVEPQPENSYNLTLEDEISVNFYLDTEFYEAQGGTIKYSYITTTDEKIADTVSKEVEVDDISTDAGSKLTINTAPAQIAESYVIEIYDAQGTLKDTIETSIQDYCNTILEGNFDQKDKDVAQALLNYGQLANEYFGYEQEHIQATGDSSYSVDHSNDYTADVDAESFKNKRAFEYTPGVDASGKPFSITGVTYVALLDPEFRFYISQANTPEQNEVWAYYTDLSIEGEGLNAEMVKTESGICVRVTGLKASDFAKPFTLHIGTAELTYNGYAFLYAVLKDGSSVDPSMKNLAKGIYRYAAACEAKFAE